MRARSLAALAALLATLAGAVQPGAPPRAPGVLGLPEVRPDLLADEVPLLLSDSPERPRQGGLLYRDTVRGEARVLAYHANGLGRPARLVVLARDVGGAGGVLVTTRRGAATTPGPDPAAGQQTLLRYLASRPLAPRALPPGGAAVLYRSEPLAPDAVTSVMLDLRANAPTRLSVLMLADGERLTPAGLEALPVLARDDRHQRGTFRGANRTLRLTLPAGTARLTLGGREDPALRGTDALTGEGQVLLGNYGVVYTLEVTGARGRRLLLAPRGGVYRGVIGVEEGGRTLPVLIGRGRALRDPGAPAALWAARRDPLTLRFVPGNGSNLPVALVFSTGEEPRAPGP